jgi:hypothetical protein
MRVDLRVRTCLSKCSALENSWPQYVHQTMMEKREGSKPPTGKKRLYKRQGFEKDTIWAARFQIPLPSCWSEHSSLASTGILAVCLSPAYRYTLRMMRDRGADSWDVSKPSAHRLDGAGLPRLCFDCTVARSQQFAALLCRHLWPFPWPES